MLYSLNVSNYIGNAILEIYWGKILPQCKTMTVNDVADIKTALNDTLINCWVKTGNEIFEAKQMVMHQSFVTTAPPPTGKGGDYDFSAFSALL